LPIADCRLSMAKAPKGRPNLAQGNALGQARNEIDVRALKGARQLKAMPQSLTKLHIHLIFSTKLREPLLLRPFRERVHAYLATVLNNLDSPAQKIGGMSDHVHILFRMSKNHALAKVVETVKTSSSKWIKTQDPALRAFHWQNGYGGFSVSPLQVEAAVQYIDHQEEHHRAVSFQDEYRKFLQTYGVEYDERYVWD